MRIFRVLKDLPRVRHRLQRSGCGIPHTHMHHLLAHCRGPWVDHGSDCQQPRRSKDEVVGRPLRILHGFNHGVSSLSNTLLRVGFISQGSFNVCWCAPMDKAPCNATFRLGRRDDAPSETSASLIIPRSFISKNHLFLGRSCHVVPFTVIHAETKHNEQVHC